MLQHVDGLVHALQPVVARAEDGLVCQIDPLHANACLKLTQLPMQFFTCRAVEFLQNQGIQRLKTFHDILCQERQITRLRSVFLNDEWHSRVSALPASNLRQPLVTLRPRPARQACSLQDRALFLSYPTKLRLFDPARDASLAEDCV